MGNLPYSLHSSHLSQLFGEAGNVVSVEVGNVLLPFFLHNVCSLVLFIFIFCLLCKLVLKKYTRNQISLLKILDINLIS